MDKKSKKTQKRYDRFSSFYDLADWPFEKFIFKPWRKKVIPKLKGKILEIGIGTGKNLGFYDYDKVELIGIDISNGMLSEAKKKVKMFGYPVKLLLNKSETLPFQKNSFDCIVTSCVLCSVSNQMKMLNEMKRVLKKNGKMVMFEHMLSENKFIAFIEHLHNPLTKIMFGFNINRPTLTNIKKSGLKIKKSRNVAFYDVFKELELGK